jgi:hypothetical protein
MYKRYKMVIQKQKAKKLRRCLEVSKVVEKMYSTKLILLIYKAVQSRLFGYPKLLDISNSNVGLYQKAID